MNQLIESLRHPAIWALSAQLLVLYCVSVGLFFAVDSGNRAASDSLKDSIKKGSAPAQLFLVLIAAASNALAVWTFVFLCRKLNTVPRLAMVGLPFLLLVEKHVRAVRANRESRRSELLLAVGVTFGIIGAAVVFMHGYPVK